VEPTSPLRRIVVSSAKGYLTAEETASVLEMLRADGQDPDGVEIEVVTHPDKALQLLSGGNRQWLHRARVRYRLNHQPRRPQRVWRRPSHGVRRRGFRRPRSSRGPPEDDDDGHDSDADDDDLAPGVARAFSRSRQHGQLRYVSHALDSFVERTLPEFLELPASERAKAWSALRLEVERSRGPPDHPARLERGDARRRAKSP
jgi:hypothetical protein